MGKIINSIRRDGLVSTGRTVLNSVRTLFQRVAPGDVLFVTGGVGRSAVYRCHNQAEELNLHGIKASVAVQDNSQLLLFANRFSVFVFHRTIFTNKIKKLIEAIKAQGKEIIFETDDLNFDPNYLQKTDYYQKITSLEREQIKQGIGAEVFHDSNVKTCVTSTTFLANKLGAKGKNVFVSKNKLSQHDVEVAEKIFQRKNKQKDEVVHIGYFSGTSSHDRDFATIENVLVEILRKHKNVKLFLAGPLEIGGKFDGFRDQIEQVSFAPMDKHLENVAGVDINIVPLEDNDFCRSKSEIKFIEAGIVGVPTVACDNQTFRETIDEGLDGYLALGWKEWFEKLSKLIVDKKLRQAMSQRARQKVLNRYTTKSPGNEDYYIFLHSKINNQTNDHN